MSTKGNPRMGEGYSIDSMVYPGSPTPVQLNRRTASAAAPGVGFGRHP